MRPLRLSTWQPENRNHQTVDHILDGLERPIRVGDWVFKRGGVNTHIKGSDGRYINHQIGLPEWFRYYFGIVEYIRTTWIQGIFSSTATVVFDSEIYSFPFPKQELQISPELLYQVEPNSIPEELLLHPASEVQQFIKKRIGRIRSLFDYERVVEPYVEVRQISKVHVIAVNNASYSESEPICSLS